MEIKKNMKYKIIVKFCQVHAIIYNYTKCSYIHCYIKAMKGYRQVRALLHQKICYLHSFSYVRLSAIQIN